MLSLFVPYGKITVLKDITDRIAQIEGNATVRTLSPYPMFVQQFLLAVGRGQWLCKQAGEIGLHGNTSRTVFAGHLTGGGGEWGRKDRKMISTKLSAHTDGIKIERGHFYWRNHPYGKMLLHIHTNEIELLKQFNDTLGGNFILGGTVIWQLT